MLPGSNRRLYTLSAQRSHLRVKVKRVIRIGERAMQVSRPAFDTMLTGDLFQFDGIAAHQDRVRNQARSIRERKTTLLPNRQNRTYQMLVQAHAPRNAVHDDPYPPIVHQPLLELFLQPATECFSDSRKKLRSRASGPSQKITIIRTITVPSNMVSAQGYPNRSRNMNSMAVAGEATSTPS